MTHNSLWDIAICDPDSLGGWIKAAARSVYPEKGDCPSPPTNAKWKTPDVLADVPHVQPCGTDFMMTRLATQ